jgi:hypothetical protein
MIDIVLHAAGTFNNHGSNNIILAFITELQLMFSINPELH